MNNKPNLPDELDLIGGKKDYSLRTDWKVNGWLYAAVILSAASDVFFPHQIREWPMALRTIVVTGSVPRASALDAEFCAMDTRDGRIASPDNTGRVFLCDRRDALCRYGLASSGSGGSFSGPLPDGTETGGSWDIGGVWLILGLMTGFYILGGKIFNRRYQ